ncbi:MAG: hypothetical protein SO126_12195 [Parabacteroides distasonis]|jgi:hypothetical protein|nr:hypothetical protein [Parabacteroides distasonis]MDY4914708.1 hypothetical protein [Parabacteroides distasonis]
MQNAKLSTKVQAAASILDIPVGERRKFKIKDVKICSMRSVISRLKKRGYYFSLSEKGREVDYVVTKYPCRHEVFSVYEDNIRIGVGIMGGLSRGSVYCVALVSDESVSLWDTLRLEDGQSLRKSSIEDITYLMQRLSVEGYEWDPVQCSLTNKNIQ